jgi:hypothetical protein
MRQRQADHSLGVLRTGHVQQRRVGAAGRAEMKKSTVPLLSDRP